MHAVGILAAIGYFGPFVYGALTRTDPGSLAPIFGVLIAIFGIPVAIGMGLMAYGTHH